MSKKIFVFDLDDTIINNHEIDYKSFELVLLKMKITAPQREYFVELRQKGFDSKDIFSALVKKADVFKCLKDRQKLLKRWHFWVKFAILSPYATEILKAIHGKGHMIILVTKKGREIVKPVLKAFKLNEYIDIIISVSSKHETFRKIISEYKGIDIIFINDDETELEKISGDKIKKYIFLNTYKQYKNQTITTMEDLKVEL
jgi:phosphoglycolate phosphatase-like HAD superfamily hydrolase